MSSRRQSDDETTWSTFLDDFIARESLGKSAPTRRRYERVRGRMIEMFDEHEIDEDLGVETLIECLPTFLHDDWLLASDTDARTQVSLSERLMTRLRVTRTLAPRQMLRSWLTAESAVFHARTRVRTRPPRREREAAPDDRPVLTLIRGGLDDV